MFKNLKYTFQFIIDFFWFLPQPWFWLSIDTVDLVWDEKLNQMIDDNVHLEEEKVLANETFNIILDGKYKVWVKNYPYGYGNIYGSDGLPRRRTRQRLRKFLSQKRCKMLDNEKRLKVVEKS